METTTEKKQLARIGIPILLIGLSCSSAVAGPGNAGITGSADTGIPKEIYISPDSVSMETFAGYYRFPNRVAYIRFFEQEGQFLAQQVWDGRTYPLVRTGPLRFQSQDEAYLVTFIEDDEKTIDQVHILGRVVLERVSYDPTQYIALHPEHWQPLVGRYRFQKDEKLELIVSVRDGQLVVTQSWDQKTIVFEAFSPLDFFNEALTFPLTFRMENGVVLELISYESDHWERVEP